ncbi:MAG: SPFH domain-containing protein, partial [Planctomycetota bacterium]
MADANLSPTLSAGTPPPAAEDAATRSLTEALRVSFGLLKLAMLLAVIVFFLRGFFIVNTGTVALKKRFGSYVKSGGSVKEYREGGIYYAIPLIETVDVVELRRETILLDRAFYPKRNIAQEATGGGAGGPLQPGVDGYAITGDTNILHTMWQLEYEVVNPYLYRTSFQERVLDTVNPQTGKPLERSGPEQYLREVFRNAVVRVTAGISIDDALNNRRYESRVASFTKEALRLAPCGIALRKVSLKAPTPPRSTAAAFREVKDAQSEASSRISRAEAERREAVNRANGEAAGILSDARVYRSDTVSAARSDAEKIRELLNRFPEDPEGLQIYLDQHHR